MRESPGGKNSSPLGPHSGILLANYEVERYRLRQEMLSLPANVPYLEIAGARLCLHLQPWPFAQWGIDIVGSLPTTPAQKKLLLGATDYFSKWIEADAFSSIKDRDVTRFIWKNMVCRFGILRSIVSDNGLQFDSRVYQDFFQELKIKNLYSTPRYPQSNGQAEASNKTLLTALKKRLDFAKGKWVKELPGCSGPTELLPESQPTSPRLHSPTGWKPSSPSKLACPLSKRLPPSQEMRNQ